MERSEIIHLLASCEFFKGLQKDDLEEMANLCTVETYGAGDHIFRQGARGDRIYIVAQGNVFLERSLDLGIRKGTASIGMLTKGKVFGCWSSLLNEEHTLMGWRGERTMKSMPVTGTSSARAARIAASTSDGCTSAVTS